MSFAANREESFVRPLSTVTKSKSRNLRRPSSASIYSRQRINDEHRDLFGNQNFKSNTSSRAMFPNVRGQVCDQANPQMTGEHLKYLKTVTRKFHLMKTKLLAEIAHGPDANATTKSKESIDLVLARYCASDDPAHMQVSLHALKSEMSEQAKSLLGVANRHAKAFNKESREHDVLPQNRDFVELKSKTTGVDDSPVLLSNNPPHKPSASRKSHIPDCMNVSVPANSILSLVEINAAQSQHQRKCDAKVSDLEAGLRVSLLRCQEMQDKYKLVCQVMAQTKSSQEKKANENMNWAIEELTSAIRSKLARIEELENKVRQLSQHNAPDDSIAVEQPATHLNSMQEVGVQTLHSEDIIQSTFNADGECGNIVSDTETKSNVLDTETKHAVLVTETKNAVLDTETKKDLLDTETKKDPLDTETKKDSLDTETKKAILDTENTVLDAVMKSCANEPLQTITPSKSLLTGDVVESSKSQDKEVNPSDLTNDGCKNSESSTIIHSLQEQLRAAQERFNECTIKYSQNEALWELQKATLESALNSQIQKRNELEAIVESQHTTSTSTNKASEVMTTPNTENTTFDNEQEVNSEELHHKAPIIAVAQAMYERLETQIKLLKQIPNWNAGLNPGEHQTVSELKDMQHRWKLLEQECVHGTTTLEVLSKELNVEQNPITPPNHQSVVEKVAELQYNRAQWEAKALETESQLQTFKSTHRQQVSQLKERIKRLEVIAGRQTSRSRPWSAQPKGRTNEPNCLTKKSSQIPSWSRESVTVEKHSKPPTARRTYKGARTRNNIPINQTRNVYKQSAKKRLERPHTAKVRSRKSTENNTEDVSLDWISELSKEDQNKLAHRIPSHLLQQSCGSSSVSKVSTMHDST